MNIQHRRSPVARTDLTAQLIAALNDKPVALCLNDGAQVYGRVTALHSKNFYHRSNLTVPARVEVDIVVETVRGEVNVPLIEIASTRPV